MKVDIVFHGFPGRMTRGYMSWSSVVYLEVNDCKIVFDTGGMVERSEVPKRFKDRGISLNEIDIVVLSHFHYDHAMNFDFFPNARILLHEAEINWVLSDPDDWPIPKYLFPALEKTGRLEAVSKDIEIAPGVKTLHSPGHTPGCMSLVLSSNTMPTTVLAGDAVKNLNELATGEVAMSWDNEASAETIRRIREIAKVVIPGHDRVLEVAEDKIVAATSVRETIIVPAGVADLDKPRLIELVVEPTCQLIKK
ncbi:beta-lactamase domain protein [Thermosinus carboxydivorans Nor1]|uniref:Beta-lactamase domain protein n=1 Tax=Thermosinus carboxydivorans Nor1 TaxID=401526 RepID=A1HRB4_9FIRM|nr:MBL fold metallo-hydrolase [Thermosinus carboxydivorans]EAX47429.1 beta-lactamase domain protein [Thermosinus carboxydivorans Nor1]